MISPTVGRVVWFWPTGLTKTEQPWAALVTFVHDDHRINVGGFNANGEPFAMTSVRLLQDDDPSTAPCATWMPYQKGQAANVLRCTICPPPTGFASGLATA